MATSYATPRLKSFVGTLLGADATLRTLMGPAGSIQRDPPPQNTPVPYILVDAASPAVPVKVIGNQTNSENAVLTVLGVTRASNNLGLVPIMERVNELLEGASGTYDGVEIFVLSGEGEIDYPEPREPGTNLRFWRLGRYWRTRSKAGP